MDNDKREDYLRRIEEAFAIVEKTIDELKWEFPVQTFIVIFAEWEKYYPPELEQENRELVFKNFYQLPIVKELLELFRHREEIGGVSSNMSLNDTFKKLISLDSVKKYVKYQRYYEALTYYKRKLTGLTK